MWSNSIPPDTNYWALCDGTNGTPDLRGRFILSSGSSYTVGQTGGESDVTLSTAQMPSHTHQVSGSTDYGGTHNHVVQWVYPNSNNQVIGSAWNQFQDPLSMFNPADSAHPENSSVTSLDNGNHYHTIGFVSQPEGGGGSHNNMPPYYVLAYFMRIA
jgi:microcystin-dependent protein